MSFAVELALGKSAETGIAWVGVRNGNHSGAGGVDASMALERDMVGVYMAVGNANHMAPWGGVDPLLSTNPIAIEIPAGDEPGSDRRPHVLVRRWTAEPAEPAAAQSELRDLEAGATERVVAHDGAVYVVGRASYMVCTSEPWMRAIRPVGSSASS